MATQKKIIGKLPVFRGEYNKDVVYYKHNIVTYLGSSFISTKDENMSAPCTVGDKEFILSSGWEFFSDSSEAYFMDERFDEMAEVTVTTDDEDEVNNVESDVVNEAIRKTPQTLSKAEQAQARTNIGAASLEENEAFKAEVKEQVVSIDAKVSNIGSEVEMIESRMTGVSISETGKGIRVDGRVSSWETSCIFKKIRLDEGDTIQISTATFGQCVIATPNGSVYTPLVNAVETKPKDIQKYTYTAENRIDIVCSGYTSDTKVIVFPKDSIIERLEDVRTDSDKQSSKQEELAIKQEELAIKQEGVIDSSYIVNSFIQFESGSFNSNGQPEDNSRFFRSSIFHELPIIRTNAEPLVVRKSSGIVCYIYWYKSDYSFIKNSTQIKDNESEITPPSEAVFCKVLVAKMPDVSNFTKKLLVGEYLAIRTLAADSVDVLKKVDNLETEIKSFEKSSSFDLFSYGWSTGSYYDVIAENASRRYKVIKVKKGERYRIHKPSSYWKGYLYYADSLGVIDYISISDNIEILIEERNGRLPLEVRITILHDPDKVITDELWDSFDIKMYNVTRKALNKTIVSTWNWGMLNNGVSPTGIADEEVDVQLPKIKKLITGLESDVLIATEYVLYLDRSKTRDVYSEVLKQFYPYKLTTRNAWSAIFSKHPFHVELTTSPDGRDYLLGAVNINGDIIGLGAIHPRSDSSTESEDARITDHQMVIDYFAKYDKAIVMGDFNTYEDRELDVYREAGWNLGNCGYFGNVDTYKPSSRPWYIDNIVTKGINIDNFFKVDDRADVSDHYPVVAKLSFF